MGGYWYVGPAPDGRIYCWAKEPSYTCPVHEAASDARREPGVITEDLELAARRLGVEPRWLAMRVAGASHGRARVEEKLTERCHCGARMTRLGFAHWTERPRTQEELKDPSAQISSRLFGADSAATVQDGPRSYQTTKKDAEAWARRQLSHAKAGAA